MESINLSAIKKETTYQVAYKKLKEAILTGGLIQERFYTEVELAKVLNISRTPVREAVKDLIHDNLLVAVPRKGMKIRAFTEIEIEQVFMLRRAIESDVLNKFVKTVTAPQLSRLDDYIDLQKQAIKEKDEIKFIRLDQKFHNSIINFCSYQLVEEVIVKLHNLTRLIGHKAIMRGGRMEEVILEHQDILKAIKENDAEQAKAKLKYHLEETEQSLWVINHPNE